MRCDPGFSSRSDPGFGRVIFSRLRIWSSVVWSPFCFCCWRRRRGSNHLISASGGGRVLTDGRVRIASFEHFRHRAFHNLISAKFHTKQLVGLPAQIRQRSRSNMTCQEMLDSDIRIEQYFKSKIDSSILNLVHIALCWGMRGAGEYCSATPKQYLNPVRCRACLVV